MFNPVSVGTKIFIESQLANILDKNLYMVNFEALGNRNEPSFLLKDFRLTFSEIISTSESLVDFFGITNSGDVFNIPINNSSYVIVDDLVTDFTLKFNGIDGATFINNFDINDFNNCYLDITNTSLVSSNKNQVYVTDNVSFSTVNNEFFTFYYFNTGSLILGFSPASATLTAPLEVPVLSSLRSLSALTETSVPTPEPDSSFSGELTCCSVVYVNANIDLNYLNSFPGEDFLPDSSEFHEISKPAWFTESNDWVKGYRCSDPNYSDFYLINTVRPNPNGGIFDYAWKFGKLVTGVDPVTQTSYTTYVVDTQWITLQPTCPQEEISNQYQNLPYRYSYVEVSCTPFTQTPTSFAWSDITDFFPSEITALSYFNEEPKESTRFYGVYEKLSTPEPGDICTYVSTTAGSSSRVRFLSGNVTSISYIEPTYSWAVTNDSGDLVYAWVIANVSQSTIDGWLADSGFVIPSPIEPLGPIDGWATFNPVGSGSKIFEIQPFDKNGWFSLNSELSAAAAVTGMLDPMRVIRPYSIGGTLTSFDGLSGLELADIMSDALSAQGNQTFYLPSLYTQTLYSYTTAFQDYTLKFQYRYWNQDFELNLIQNINTNKYQWILGGTHNGGVFFSQEFDNIVLPETTHFGGEVEFFDGFNGNPTNEVAIGSVFNPFLSAYNEYWQ